MTHAPITIAEWLANGVDDLDTRLEGLDVTAADRADWYAEWQQLADTARRLRAACDVLEAKIADSLPNGEWTTLGDRDYRRGRDQSFRNWDSDQLLRAVLDSRKVDPETGEVHDETPIDKLKACYNLGGYNAVRGELKRRRIALDEFADVEWGRVRLRVKP